VDPAVAQQPLLIPRVGPPSYLPVREVLANKLLADKTLWAEISGLAGQAVRRVGRAQSVAARQPAGQAARPEGHSLPGESRQPAVLHSVDSNLRVVSAQRVA